MSGLIRILFMEHLTSYSRSSRKVFWWFLTVVMAFLLKLNSYLYLKNIRIMSILFIMGNINMFCQQILNQKKYY